MYPNQSPKSKQSVMPAVVKAAYPNQNIMVPGGSTVIGIPGQRSTKKQSEEAKSDVWNHSEKPHSTKIPTRHLWRDRRTVPGP
jgi:hypothetical protein